MMNDEFQKSNEELYQSCDWGNACSYFISKGFCEFKQKICNIWTFLWFYGIIKSDTNGRKI